MAPKDIQDLVRELNSIEESGNITHMLEWRNVRQEVELNLVQALQQCLDAVEELRSHIAEADITFQEGGHSRRSRGYQRLKVMFGKQDIKASIDRLSRAKAQSNCLL